MKNGIFFLTYDGYYNYTSGIGTQTKTFLKGIEKYYENFASCYGDFEINLIVPRFDETVYGYNKNDVDFANEIVHKTGGNVYACNSSLDKEGSDFWIIDNWKKVSFSAADIVLKEAHKYKKYIVIAIDPPFLHVPKYIAEKINEKVNIKFVVLMYTSAYIHDEKIHEDRVKWEFEGFQLPHLYQNIKIGNVCKYMTEHFIAHYGVTRESFIPYPSSLPIESDEFLELPQHSVVSILQKYNIPLNENLVFAFGRTSWVKGFDTLLGAFSSIKNYARLILIATQFVEGDTEKYRDYIEKHNVKCTLFTEFNRELSIALCQYEKCKIVVCPSRREPFSNIPLEVGLWAKNHGPIVLASALDSFKEQINDGQNGFLFKVNNDRDLSMKIDSILSMPENQINIIRTNAYNRVIKERDFYKNFKLLLELLWN